jgi:hypothetical protein
LKLAVQPLLKLAATQIGNMTMKQLVTVYRWLIIACVSGAMGAIANVALLFLTTFLFAGADGDSWVKWYFGYDGAIFISVTLLLSLVAFPFVKHLRM